MAGLLAGPAIGQTQPSTAVAAGTAVPSASTGDLPATVEAAPGAEKPGEIVVTGLKRDEKLINIPVSVAVFDSMKIQNIGIAQPSDFLQQTSNVNVSSAASAGDFLIDMRGQSSVRGAEPSVAIIIDGAKIGVPAEFNTALYDLEQIEVLKGPQGAYYGRNATAGAIVLTTKKPTEEFSGTAYASYGNNNAYNAVMSVSGALIPNALRARVSFDVKGTDGSYKNAITDENVERFYEKSARLRLNFDNGGPFTADFRLTGIYGTGGAEYFMPKIQAVPGLSPNGTIVHGVSVTDISPSKNLNVPFISDVPGRYRRKIISEALKMDYDLGGATLTSITGFSYANELFGGKNFPYSNPGDPSTNYFGWTAVFGDKTQNTRSKTSQLQQEIRLTSKGQHFIDWQAGFEFTYSRRYYLTTAYLNGALPANLLAAYAANPQALNGYVGYTTVNGVATRTLIGGGNSVAWPLVLQGLNSAYPSTAYYQDRYTAHNYAPYANAKVNFTKRLSLLLAARYDIEQRQIASVGPDLPDPFLGGASFNPCVRITHETDAQCRNGEHKTFRQAQPKVTLNYSVPGLGSIYADWGRSFKSGGFNSIGTRETTVQSVAATLVALGQTAAQARSNAEASVIAQDYYRKEVSDTYEIGFKAELFDHRLYLNGAAFWTNTSNGQLYVFDPVSHAQSIQSIDKERVKGFEFDGNFKLTNAVSLFASYGYIDPRILKLAASPSAVGNRPPYVALNTLSVGAQVNQPISDTKSLTARIEYNRTGTTYYTIDNSPGYRRDPYGLVNGRLGISTPRWDAALFGRNLLNKHYVTEVAPITNGVSTALTLAELRTYGVEFRVRF